MTDSSSLTTTSSTESSSLKDKLSPPQSDSTLSPNQKRASSAPPSWRSKLHLHHSKPSEPDKEKWRDASLPEKERWKEWQKDMDRNRRAGSTAGAFTQFYKGTGKWAYWIGGY